MRRVLGSTLVVALALLGTSCGDAAPDATTVLGERVDAIRLAVEGGNTDRAHTLLERLERTVDRLLANGQLTDEQAVAMIAAAGDVTETLSLIEPETSPSFSPSPSPEDEGHEGDEEHGKGKGKGHDEEGD